MQGFIRRRVPLMVRRGVTMAPALLVLGLAGRLAAVDPPIPALIEVRSKDEALELARRFWKVVGDGEGDIRQVFGPGD